MYLNHEFGHFRLISHPPSGHAIPTTKKNTSPLRRTTAVVSVCIILSLQGERDALIDLARRELARGADDAPDDARRSKHLRRRAL